MKCNICEYECSSKQGLSRHLRNQHNFSLSGYQIKYYYEGKYPLCKCGCKEKVKWFPGNGSFRNFIQNHSQLRFKKPKKDPVPENVRRRKISETLKEKYRSGERKPWQHTNPDAKEISRLSSEKRANTISERANKGCYDKNKFWSTKPELKFENFLKKKKIKYVRQFKLKGSNHPYDFYLPYYNLIVEIDGDFWHCNEITEPRWKNEKFSINGRSKTDIREKDKMHTEYALKHGYNIKRIWESDVNGGDDLLPF
jgi:very-short-patch-repair endonuclease